MAAKVNAEPKPGRSNGYDPEVLKGIVGNIDKCFDRLDSLRGSYMHDCKDVREDMAAFYDEAKEKGVPKKELKAVIKTRLLERKAAAVRDDLEDDQADNFDMIRHALGDFIDTDLGKAAADRAAA